MSTKLVLSGDVAYEGDIDNFVAAKVIALVEQGDSYSQASQVSEETTSLPAGIMFSDRSLVEVFDYTGAKTNPQRIAVAGQKSMEETGSETFTTKDIAEQFRSAGFSSKNLARDVAKAVRQGLIFSPTGKRGQYKVTDIAKQAFKDSFDQVKSLAPKPISRRSRRGGVTQKQEVSEAVRELPSEVSLDGYQDYFSYTTKGDHMIWLLTFAATHGVESLNPKEIEIMSRRIGDQISPSSIPSLALSAIRRGLIAKSEGNFRVLEKGKIYLQQEKGRD